MAVKSLTFQKNLMGMAHLVFILIILSQVVISTVMLSSPNLAFTKSADPNLTVCYCVLSCQVAFSLSVSNDSPSITFFYTNLDFYQTTK